MMSYLGRAFFLLVYLTKVGEASWYDRDHTGMTTSSMWSHQGQVNSGSYVAIGYDLFLRWHFIVKFA